MARFRLKKTTVEMWGASHVNMPRGESEFEVETQGSVVQFIDRNGMRWLPEELDPVDDEARAVLALLKVQ